jgi:hypothetical protein
MKKFYKSFLQYAPKYFADTFGTDMNVSSLFELISIQLYKTPDKYLPFLQGSNNFESMIEATLEGFSNISQKKIEIQSNFKQLNMSMEGFRAYFSFLWYSSLPCFDVTNITAEQNGDSAVIKKCWWKGQPIPCSSIFKKVCYNFKN